jgi:dolichol-phosphate mannosyltransferase
LISNSQAHHEILSHKNISISPRDVGAESFAAAIQIGINNIRFHDYVVFMDGDQSHQPEQIGKLVDVLYQSDEFDVSISSRYTDGGTSENSLVLRAMSKTLNFVFRKFLKLNARDVSTNFKAYRAPLLREVKLVSKNFEAVEELLIHATMRLGRGLSIREIPDKFTIRIHGESKRKLGQFIGTYLISLFVLKRKVRNQKTDNQS